MSEKPEPLYGKIFDPLPQNRIFQLFKGIVARSEVSKQIQNKQFFKEEYRKYFP